MSEENTGVSKEKQILRDARAKGGLAVPIAYLKCSGPGFLQGAITLAGGSLAGSLYLGIYGGYSMLWLQLLAMLVGILMLSAITYVTLSTGCRPFQAINEHINPVLGWGWALATLMANIVWCLPQFSLGSAAVKQNLFKGLEVNGKWSLLGLSPDQSTWLVCLGILAIAVTVVWFYDSGGGGIRLFELILKLMVAGIVLCFVGVVVQLSLKGILNWKEIGQGFIPNMDLLTQPSKTFAPYLEKTGEFSDFWNQMIVDAQRSKMITAAATAVGINMTFLLPYSMLKKGWDRESRGLAIFDLGIGLAIPFLLATSAVVIAASVQFHTKPELSAMDGSDKVLAGNYQKNLKARLANEMGAEGMAKLEAAVALGVNAEKSLENANLSVDQRSSLEKLVPLKTSITDRLANMPKADKEMAAMLINRDAFQLAGSLSALTGDKLAHYVFGVGILGMAISTIIILMLISGFTVCEMLGVPHRGWMHRFGCMLPAIGVAGPFLFTGQAKVWMAVPTSMFGWTLLPIAYLSFFLLINNKKVMGDQRPSGFGGMVFNILMFAGVLVVGVAAAWTVWTSIRWAGVGIISFLVVLSWLVHVARKERVAVKAAKSAKADKPVKPLQPIANAPAVAASGPGDQGETVLLKPEDFAKSDHTPKPAAATEDGKGNTVVLTPADVAKAPAPKAAPKVAKVSPVKVAPAPVKPKVAVAPAPVKPAAPKADPGYTDTSSLTGGVLL
jgi:Mn2+/Fe2+ NRAMP family transporter